MPILSSFIIQKARTRKWRYERWSLKLSLRPVMITARRPCLGWQTLWWSPRLTSAQDPDLATTLPSQPVTAGNRPLIGQKCKPGPLIGQYWGILTKTFRMSLTCGLCVISSGTDAGIVPINTFIVFILHWHNSIILFMNTTFISNWTLVIGLLAHWKCDSLNSYHP